MSGTIIKFYDSMFNYVVDSRQLLELMIRRLQDNAGGKDMVNSMERWVGKVAIVTGASSGIGAAIAEALVKHGLNVVGIARRVDLIREKAEKLSSENGKLYAVKADIAKEQDVIDAFWWTSQNVGPVHILINNAGIGRGSNLTDGLTEDWKAVLDVNVIGVCVATREAIKIMKDNGVNGHIVHIGSVAGHYVPSVGTNIYSPSKFAARALTETLRQELVRLGSKIKVTHVSPGLVVSEATTENKNATPAVKAFFKDLPILQAEDVADSVLYALSTPEHVQIHELMIRPVGDKF